ncbi:hydrogenase maturation nickel metallochaperone HypA [Beggiatoa leptomitoformis]|uniref:Hydrogenase maturation factor HypA n=1 Tax=Beggiatoa leptomitoformis TaxID=288004 RepID=A0A2N9YB14_9GAMM|nr:hydrogenase maturation nickel metallochaperone HypA [Beggiatoa leptomitoformis]ALG66964.1 hydrogenase maturation nickel metallochaperone HypA [Beggiatoa leptomitoformis]AUI67665.1 hydrogenase maturation nickel metallochaperone HypA [Beggiatoa leptomitoformis]
MHELSICYSLLNQVETLAQHHQAHQVASITIQIGLLSGVEPELLRQAFTIARAGTVAAQADLICLSLPVKVRCQQCHAESEVEANRLLCKTCGAWQTQVISGDEMLLASVELIT